MATPTLLADFSELKNLFLPEELFSIGSHAFTKSMFFASVVVLFIIFAALLIRIFYIPRFKFVAKGLQSFLEWIVCAFDKMAEENTKPFAKFLGPYTFGAAAFIFFSILIELFGAKSPLVDLNACISLALMSFILINFCGIKKHGPVGRVKYYFKPMFVVGPIRIISDMFIPVSMSLRLFGAALSGLIGLEFIYLAAPYLMPVGSAIFTLFHALIQAYVFALLTLIFVAEATE